MRHSCRHPEPCQMLKHAKSCTKEKQRILITFEDAKNSLDLECTEGWECNLGSRELEIFFANNGLGGFLGPNWKVFHHGTLCEHFQGVVIAFRSWPGGENGAKIG